ncbi:hypothetical protein B0H17DRAFT_1135877 [Mycena rosella]|uniref:Uncharacterized protein n=1 Tax=Mycena rosella TaxID=1033263 RepID=A0AAD7DC61_MYCRO|nr:hypothetical protein B0H17DRAFT_1135877 [Mycena rosella]
MVLKFSDEVCPRCKAHFLTAPRECLGTFDPENVGRSFQHCARHEFTPNAGCKFSLWNNADADTDPSGFGGPVNSSSHPQVSPDSSLSMSSGASSGTSSSPGKPWEPCSNTTANCHSDRNGNCVQLFCPTGSPSTLSALSALLPATPATPSTLTSFTLAKPYARPVDPSYAAKLQAGGFELSGANQAASYKKARAQTIEAFWWAKISSIQDHEPAEAFSVVALHFPLFHPKDSPLIVQFVGELNARNFSFWDGQWWKRTDAAITVQSAWTDLLPSHNASVPLRLIAYLPPPSNLFVIEPLVFDMPEAQKRQKTDVMCIVIFGFCPYSHHTSRDLISDNENDVFQTTGRSSNTKMIKFEATIIVDTTTTTSPSKSLLKSPWPLRYACDMDQGFRAMKNQSSGTILVKFKAAFDTDFTSTTFYDNLNKWKALSSEVRHQIVAPGRVQEAEWVYVLRNYGKVSGSNVHKTSSITPSMAPFRGSPLTAEFLTHRGCDLRPSPKTVEAAVELFKTEGMHVDWDVVQVTQSREVENIIRTLVHQGILMVPAQDSPLSSVPSTPIQGPTGIGMQDVVPPISGDDVIKVSATNTVTVNATNNNVNIADTGGAVHRITAHNWHGPFEEFEESWLWGFIAFGTVDPEADVAPFDVKVIVVNHVHTEAPIKDCLDEEDLLPAASAVHLLQVRCFNGLKFMEFVSSAEQLDDNRTVIPQTAYTRNALTCNLICAVLNHYFPGGAFFSGIS